MWIDILLAIIAFSGGCVVAGSFLAFISLIGIVPRLAAVTKTEKYVILYEDFFIFGATFGNLLLLYDIAIPVGKIGAGILGFFGGIFIGCLASALSEVTTSIPILARRIKLRKGLPYVIFALAFGKGAGSLIQFFALMK